MAAISVLPLIQLLLLSLIANAGSSSRSYNDTPLLLGHEAAATEATTATAAAAAQPPCRGSVFILGARKGGTTSLYHYLMAHPDFWPVVVGMAEERFWRAMAPRRGNGANCGSDYTEAQLV